MAFLAAVGVKPGGGRGVFDAFGDHREAELLAQLDGGRHDGGVAGVRAQLDDERAVDLQSIKRKLLQIAQARIAGAEVVKHHVHAEVLNLAKHRQGILGVRQDDVLGDLQFEQHGVELRLAQDRANRGQEGAGEHLRGRQVDADANGLAGLFPGARLTAGGFENPQRDAIGNRRRVHDRNELARSDQAARRVTPADQGLGAHHGVIGKPHLRLVEKLELAAVDRERELGLQRQARFKLLPEGVLEGHDCAVLVRLGAAPCRCSP